MKFTNKDRSMPRPRFDVSCDESFQGNSAITSGSAIFRSGDLSVQVPIRAEWNPSFRSVHTIITRRGAKSTEMMKPPPRLMQNHSPESLFI
ncbi:MAG: hypothetical protein LBK73_16515 [Treponema sp.]|nr:hypothetical protein [Treponema sp.]